MMTEEEGEERLRSWERSFKGQLYFGEFLCLQVQVLCMSKKVCLHKCICVNVQFQRTTFFVQISRSLLQLAKNCIRAWALDMNHTVAPLIIYPFCC